MSSFIKPTLSLALAFFTMLLHAQPLAIVNGKPVQKEHLEAFTWQMNRLGQQTQEQAKPQILQELISREVLAQEALRLGFEDTPQYRDRLQLARETILIGLLVDAYAQQNPVTPAELEAAYNQYAQTQNIAQYQVRHIMVDSQAKANELVQTLQRKKGDFAVLAKNHSKDAATAANGGDIGWARLDQFQAPLAKALEKMQPGQLYERAVKSEKGWHILRLENVRQLKAPPLQEVQSQLIQTLQQQKFQSFQNQLRGKAQIEMMIP